MHLGGDHAHSRAPGLLCVPEVARGQQTGATAGSLGASEELLWAAAAAALVHPGPGLLLGLALS